MNTNSSQLFARVFHEAHVVDLDFSQWARRVRLVVVARTLPLENNHRFPLFFVDFLQPSSFAFSRTKESELIEGKHPQWVVMDSSIDETPNGELGIQLDGVGPSPNTFIQCRALEITKASNEAIDLIDPSWNAPYRGLARPGIAELAAAALARNTAV